MERLYEDAFQIEELVKKKMLMVEKVKNNKKAQSIIKNSRIGKGETSTLHLFFNIDAQAIISDDRIFLKILHQNIIKKYLIHLKKKTKILFCIFVVIVLTS